MDQTMIGIERCQAPIHPCIIGWINSILYVRAFSGGDDFALSKKQLGWHYGGLVVYLDGLENKKKGNLMRVVFLRLCAKFWHF